jgi:hypothetical protein
MSSVISASTTSTTALTLSGDTSGQLEIKTGSGPTTAMTITSGQLVGIGTSSPATPLNIVGSTTAKARLNVSGYAGLEIGQNADFTSEINQRSGSALLLKTSDTERMRIDSSGDVGIGCTPSAVGAYRVLELNNTTGGILYLQASGTRSIQLYGAASEGGLIQMRNAPLILATNNTERMRIDSSGRLLINTTTARTTLTGDRSALVQLEAQSVDQFLSIFRNENNAFGSAIWLGKSRGTTAGSNTTVQSGDTLASLVFLGANGTDTQQAAGIAVQATGTISASAMPGIMTFSTTGSGSNTPTERMRIRSDGHVGIATTGILLGYGGQKFSCNGTGVFQESGNTVLAVNRLTNDGTLVAFWQADVQEGDISVSGTTVSYNGGHLSRYAQTTAPKDESIVKGTVLSNLDEMNEYVRPTTYWTEEDELPEGVNVGDVKEESVAVDNEQLNKVKVSDVEGDVNVAGVFVNWSHDEAHNVDEINMAMTGDMIIRIAQGVVVQKGDLLMSAGDGTAKPQGDDIVRSKTIAKVTSNHVTCTYDDGSYCVPCVLMAC